MARKVVAWFMILLVPALAACGSSPASTTAVAGSEAQATPGAFFGGGEMPLSMKLPAGTLLLEDTELAVTPTQAKELLPLWQMVRSLEESTTSSQAEMDSVIEQIQGAMTKEQLAAIDDMSQEDMQALFQELGMGRQQQQSSGSTEQGGGRQGGPPEGMMPPGGGEGGVIVGPGGGEGGPGMGAGGFGNLSPEERATIVAGRGGGGTMRFGTGLTDAVIELLQKRAAES
jgi:hypothetical protein